MNDATRQPIRMLMIDELMYQEASWACINSGADALRQVHAARPRAVVIQIDSLQSADACTPVLEELHRRWPGLALIVLSSRHDDRIERAIRGSGVHCYMDVEIDLKHLGEVLSEMQTQASCNDPLITRPPAARANGPPRRLRA